MKITPNILASFVCAGGISLAVGCGAGSASSLDRVPSPVPGPVASPPPVTTPTPPPVIVPTPTPAPLPTPTPAPPVVPTTPPPPMTADQVRAVPTRIIVQGKTLVATGAVWINRMPSPSPPDDSAFAGITIVAEDGSPVPAGLTVERISVANAADLWVSTFVNRRSDLNSVGGTIRGGPEWQVGATVDIMADFFDRDGRRYQLRVPPTSIRAAY